MRRLTRGIKSDLAYTERRLDFWREQVVFEGSTELRVVVASRIVESLEKLIYQLKVAQQIFDT